MFFITLLSFYFTYLITLSLLLYCSAWINLVKLHFCKAKQMRLTTSVMQHITGRYLSKLCQKFYFIERFLTLKLQQTSRL